MNQCGIHFLAQLQKKELEDVNLPREKEKREESSQRQLCEIGERAKLQESEEQEVKSKRQLHEICYVFCDTSFIEFTWNSSPGMEH